MAGMGPPPKKQQPNRRKAGKSSLSTALVQLPASGRDGATPRWPLPNPTSDERKVWKELWASPQAVAWETLGWTRAVARYVRCLVEAEKPGAMVTLLGEVRQMEDRLGLTPMSMLRLRWEIVDDEPAAPELRVVNGGLDASRFQKLGR